MRPQITKSLAILSTTFRSNAKTRDERDALEMAWEQALSILSDSEIRLGVERALQEHKAAWFPVPGQIIAWARGQGLDATAGSRGESSPPLGSWEFAQDLNGDEYAANPTLPHIQKHPYLEYETEASKREKFFKTVAPRECAGCHQMKRWTIPGKICGECYCKRNIRGLAG